MVNYNVIFSLLLGGALFFSCSENHNNQDLKPETIQEASLLDTWRVDAKTIQGKTQGTTFTIKTSEDSLLVSADVVDRTLKAFDSELSGYISTSILSQFNAAKDTFVLPVNNYFKACFDLSYDIYVTTQGAFDPSVFPLVKLWGFFKDVKNPPTVSEIDSVLQFTGFKKGLHYELLNDSLDLTKSTFIKIDKRFQIDFNAIAQGQSVDVLGALLRQKGHTNYFIEVGGEITVSGFNNEGNPWVIGIDLPEEENDGLLAQRKLENYLSISNKGLATSGNYRKFYEKGGRKYSHTLDPMTGKPVEHNLLSATVVADNAAIADGYATAFMVLGVTKTMKFLSENPTLNLGVYLLFENAQGRLERAYNQEMEAYFL